MTWLQHLAGVLNRWRRHDGRETPDSQRLLAITVASIGEGVICADADARITFINPEAERLTGWMAKEALGQKLDSVFHVIHEGTRESTENIAVEVLRSGHI